MSQQRHLIWGSYFVAFGLAVIPPFDALMQVLPVRVGDARWRFGALGVMSNALMILLAGVLIMFATASIFEHRRFQRVMGALSIVLAVTMLGALGLFALDALQVSQQVNPAARMAFRVASITAVMKTLLASATLLALGIPSFRQAKAQRTDRTQRSDYIIGSGGRLQNTPAAGSTISGKRS